MLIREMQFEILPTVDAVDGVVFGIDADISVDDGGFDPGSGEWVTQDGQNPRTGATQFGRDQLTGPTWAWSLHTNVFDTESALEAMGPLASAWRAPEIADLPGAVLPIRYRIGGRTRRVYGRPRSYAAPPTNRILDGYVPITANFKCVDAYTYDDNEQTITLQAPVAVQTTGFRFPQPFPALTVANPSKSGFGDIVVDGDAATPVVVRFEGPSVRPWLLTDDFRIDLDITLGPNDYAEVDTRSWELSAMVNGTQSVGGKLGRRQWLTDMVLSPGACSLRYGFQASSGGSSCQVSWRNAYNSL